jgi:hypothetical protein
MKSNSCDLLCVLDYSERDDQARVIGQAYVTSANAQTFTYAAAALGPYYQRPSPIIIRNTNIPEPDSVTESRPHGFDRCFFAGESHREKAHWPLALVKQLEFFVHKDSLHKVITESIVGGLYP